MKANFVKLISEPVTEVAATVSCGEEKSNGKDKDKDKTNADKADKPRIFFFMAKLQSGRVFITINSKGLNKARQI